MVYQIKVQLRGASKPPIWRRFLIPSDASFYDLRCIIMIGFGWLGGHLYGFTEYPSEGILRIYDPEDDIFAGSVDDEPTHAASETKISDHLNPAFPKMLFIYDMGDNWEHLITLEDDNVRGCPDPEHAHCIDGKGVCPPEDCGGVYAYNELREFVLDNPEKSIAAAFEDDLDQEDDDLSEDDDENYFLEEIRGYGPFFNLVKGKPDFSKIDLNEIEHNVSNFDIEGVVDLKNKIEIEEEFLKNGYPPTGHEELDNALEKLRNLVLKAKEDLEKYKGIDPPEKSEE